MQILYTFPLLKNIEAAIPIILRVNPYRRIPYHEFHQVIDFDTSRRKKHLTLMTLKSIHNLTAPYLHEMFVFSTPQYNLRSTGNLALLKPKSEYCRRMFSYQGAWSISKIPHHISSSSNIVAFHELIKICI